MDQNRIHPVYKLLNNAESNLRQAINLSNHCLHSFVNILAIARSLESNQSAATLISVQDWLQSFLVILQDNIRHYRVHQDQVRHWVCLISLRRNRGPLDQ